MWAAPKRLADVMAVRADLRRALDLPADQAALVRTAPGSTAVLTNPDAAQYEIHFDHNNAQPGVVRALWDSRHLDARPCLPPRCDPSLPVARVVRRDDDGRAVAFDVQPHPEAPEPTRFPFRANVLTYGVTDALRGDFSAPRAARVCHLSFDPCDPDAQRDDSV